MVPLYISVYVCCMLAVGIGTVIYTTNRRRRVTYRPMDSLPNNGRHFFATPYRADDSDHFPGSLPNNGTHSFGTAYGGDHEIPPWDSPASSYRRSSVSSTASSQASFLTSSTTSSSAARCPICQRTLRSGVSNLVCGHIFHSQCLSVFLNIGMTCPICVEEVRAYEVTDEKDNEEDITDVPYIPDFECHGPASENKYCNFHFFIASMWSVYTFVKYLMKHQRRSQRNL